MIRSVYYRTVTTFLATGLTPHMTESMNHSASRQIPLSLSERQRLQRLWEEARAAMKAGEAHSPHAHRLLVECVVTDPASPLYVETLILNLQQWRGAAGAWLRWTRWLRPAALQLAWRERRWTEILQRGPDLLAADPGDLRVLLPLIDACQQTECRESAWRYLELATTLHPRQPEVRRRAGRLLLLLARFAEARLHWQAVVALAPEDQLARQFLSRLPAPEELPKVGSELSSQTAGEVGINVSGTIQGDGDSPLGAAGQQVSRSGLAAHQQAEKMLLEQHRQQIEIARQIAAVEPNEPLWQQLVEQLQSSFARVEIEVLAASCRRFPTAVDIRYELARRLRRLGNFPEAQRYLQEVIELSAPDQWNWRLAALGDLGECRQRLRQFPAAMELYRQALQCGTTGTGDFTASPIAAVTGPDVGEERCRVLRRAAVLAEALGLAPEAMGYRQELVARSPAGQESAGRLDKRLQIDDNSQSD